MKERLILHDLVGPLPASLSESRKVVLFSASPAVKPCVGCFGCWLKTPGVCVIPDRGQAFAPLLGQCGTFVIVSRLVFGGYSADVKSVLDRGIGYMLPFFTVIKGETHHAPRFKGRFHLKVLFYGSASDGEGRAAAQGLVRANAVNLCAKSHEVLFFESAQEAADELRREASE
ncbi:MAG: flavodoxin family protein [Clostridiales Family XIII bacterium]|jgi:multimeric flavodoxin WrbA|nr:flavodoxin family protein [Clostridiales Family XIII bacterium]